MEEFKTGLRFSSAQLGEKMRLLPTKNRTADMNQRLEAKDPVIFSGTVHYNLDPFGEFDAKPLVGWVDREDEGS